MIFVTIFSVDINPIRFEIFDFCFFRTNMRYVRGGYLDAFAIQL